jgi:hypothetical protein
MSKPARTMFAFAIYLAILGLTLVTVPNVLLGVFGIPPTQEVWVRVVGMLVLFLAYYHVEAARNEWAAFTRASIAPRMAVSAFFGAFVLAGLGSPVLLLFAAVDFAAALWTHVALRAVRGAPAGA